MNQSSTPENDDETGQTEVSQAMENVTTLGDRTSPSGDAQEGGGVANLDLIMDIPVTVSMELGRTRVSIRELLAMNPGKVIELQRLASEPMEILVNGTLVAHGEAVKVGDRFGVRLTSVISASDRLKQVSG